MAGELILIVEDNEKNMKLLRDVLGHRGYRTLEAVTGEEGYRSHAETGEKVIAIKDEAFAGMDEALRKGQQISEYDVREFIRAGGRGR